MKTKGRLSNNGVVVHGTRLPGASVIIKGGNPVKSGANGTFAISIPSKKYYLQNVLKKGYVLSDPDILSKEYDYSTNDVIIVMDTPDDQLEEQLDAASRIRETLTAQLHNRELEIKTLKAMNAISNEEYRRLRQELLAAQQSNEKLIDEMVERYSKIDFDQMDDFNRQVSEYILNGELTKVDSLLKTKGTIEERIEELRKHQELNRKEREEIAHRQQNLEKSEAYEKKETEDIAQDCYHFYTKCRLLQQNDSAAYYLEKRAMLDTLSFDYVWTCGSYYLNERKYEKARYYLELLTRNKTLSPVDMGMGLNDLSLCYSYMGLSSLGRETMKKSLELRMELAKEEPEKYNVSVALAACNYAAMHALFNGEKAEAKKYFPIGMDLYRKLMKHTQFFSVNLANAEENYGIMLYRDSLYDDAEQMLLKAYETRCKYAKEYPRYYNTTQNISLMDISKLVGDIDCESFQLTRECKMIIIAAAEKNKEQTAGLARSLADLYLAKHDYEKCNRYLTESCRHIEELFQDDAEKYLLDITNSYLSNAYFYLNFLNKPETADSIADKIQELLKECTVESQNNFSKELAICDALVLKGRIHQNDTLMRSVGYYREAIDVLQNMSDPIFIAGKESRLYEICTFIATQYLRKELYSMSLPYLKQARDIMKAHIAWYSDLDYVQQSYYYGLALFKSGYRKETLEIFEEAQLHFHNLPQGELSTILIRNINQAVEYLRK